MQDISTFTFFGNVFTATVSLAGYGGVKMSGINLIDLRKIIHATQEN